MKKDIRIHIMFLLIIIFVIILFLIFDIYGKGNFIDIFKNNPINDIIFEYRHGYNYSNELFGVIIIPLIIIIFSYLTVLLLSKFKIYFIYYFIYLFVIIISLPIFYEYNTCRGKFCEIIPFFVIVYSFLFILFFSIFNIVHILKQNK